MAKKPHTYFLKGCSRLLCIDIWLEEEPHNMKRKRMREREGRRVRVKERMREGRNSGKEGIPWYLVNRFPHESTPYPVDCSSMFPRV